MAQHHFSLQISRQIYPRPQTGGSGFSDLNYPPPRGTAHRRRIETHCHEFRQPRKFVTHTHPIGPVQRRPPGSQPDQSRNKQARKEKYRNRKRRKTKFKNALYFLSLQLGATPKRSIIHPAKEYFEKNSLFKGRKGEFKKSKDRNGLFLSITQILDGS